MRRQRQNVEQHQLLRRKRMRGHVAISQHQYRTDCVAGKLANDRCANRSESGSARARNQQPADQRRVAELRWQCTNEIDAEVAVRRCHANPLMADSSPRYGGGFKAES